MKRDPSRWLWAASWAWLVLAAGMCVRMATTREDAPPPRGAPWTPAEQPTNAVRLNLSDSPLAAAIQTSQRQEQVEPPPIWVARDVLTREDPFDYPGRRTGVSPLRPPPGPSRRSGWPGAPPAESGWGWLQDDVQRQGRLTEERRAARERNLRWRRTLGDPTVRDSGRIEWMDELLGGGE